MEEFAEDYLEIHALEIQCATALAAKLQTVVLQLQELTATMDLDAL